MENLKISSGISYIEKPAKLSEWAQRKITENNFSLESVKYSAEFQNFTRSEKDAIRYQLKKSGVKNVVSQKVVARAKQVKAQPKRVKTLQPVQILELLFCLGATVFLLGDLASFYSTKGFGLASALLVAVLVELGIVVGAISAKRIFLKCAYLLFAYNMAVFSLSAGFEVFKSIEQDKQQVLAKELAGAQVAELQAKVKLEQSNQKEYLEKLDTLFARNIVTSSSRAIEKLIAGSRAEISRIETQIHKIKQENLNLSQEPIALIILTSLMMLFLRGILQFLSIQCLHGIYQSRKGN